MAEHDVEVVVVGAGIAGLATAWRLRHREVVVLERAERVGGRIWSEQRGDYWLNFGAHVFAGPESATGRLLDEVGVAAAPVPGELAAISMNGRLLTDGRVETYPFRIPMSWTPGSRRCAPERRCASPSTATDAWCHRDPTTARVTGSSGSTTSSGIGRSPSSSGRCRPTPMPCSGRP